MSTASTEFGDIPIDTLVKHYELERKREARKYAKRLEFLATDEGKNWNRERSKSYYERNKAEILAKRKAWYKAKKESNTPVE